MKQVTIYSTPTRAFCHMAKNWMEEKGISFTYYDLIQDIEKANEMVEKSGQSGIPVIHVAAIQQLFLIDRSLNASWLRKEIVKTSKVNIGFLSMYY